MGKKGFIWLPLPYLHPSLRGVRAGTWRQELKHMPWRKAAYLLAPPGLLSLFTYKPQDHLLREGSATVSWAPPHQSSIKTMPSRLACRWKHFLN